MGALLKHSLGCSISQPCDASGGDSGRSQLIERLALPRAIGSVDDNENIATSASPQVTSPKIPRVKVARFLESLGGASVSVVSCAGKERDTLNS